MAFNIIKQIIKNKTSFENIHNGSIDMRGACIFYISAREKNQMFYLKKMNT